MKIIWKYLEAFGKCLFLALETADRRGGAGGQT
jgi:hypothetical protein